MSFIRKIIYLYEYAGNVRGENTGYAKLSQKETRLKIEIRLTENTHLMGEKIYLLHRDKNAVNKGFLGTIIQDEKIINIEKNLKETGEPKGEIVGLIIGDESRISCAGTDDSSLDVLNYVREEKVVEAAEIPEEEEEEEIIQVEIEAPHDEAYEYRKIFSSRSNMYPFEDDEMEACVQISPADFSDFPKSFWQMGSNSFLLQGYYNYRHLILAAAKGKLYLGIPGQYHRRDKYLADMFGFHRFKGIRKKQEKLGDFGYWLMEIEVPRFSAKEICCPDVP